MDASDPGQLVERVAALDLGKAELTACVRVPHEDRAGRRRQEVREYSTLSRSLLELADWLRCERIELVAMEATGIIRGSNKFLPRFSCSWPLRTRP
jgi:hypothetical protein